MNSHINIKQPAGSAQNLAQATLFIRLKAELQGKHQRLLVCMQGDRRWCLAQLNAMSVFSDHRVLSNADDLEQAIPFSKAEKLLGQETDCVLYDAFSGIQLDVLCMAAGLVRAGGVLLLITPADPVRMEDRYGQWQDGGQASNYFLQYFFSALEQPMLLLRQSQPDAAGQLAEFPVSTLTAFVDGATAEQQQVLQSLESWLGNKKIPLFLLTADRGRGKSTTLGMFARQHSMEQRIVLTAASRAQLCVLFNQLEKEQQSIEFIAPDELIRQQRRIELLIIDEAAMLPASVLRQCLALADRTVLATTTGGYEGSGQGFLLKFKAELATQQYLHHQLIAPVRWGQQDCLEQWLNRVLMLKAGTSLPAKVQGPYSIRMVSREQLSQNIDLLKQVYKLLINAHYRTRPSDLRQLMDNQHQQLVLAEAAGRVVGVLQLNREGGFSKELCEQVFMGRRRPQGHLFAQMITAQAGVRKFACFSGLRVQRIAVDADYRQSGLGRELIKSAQQLVQEQQLDYLATSFAIDSGVALFWQKLGFSLLHISSGTGKSSGRQTVALIRAQSPAVKKVTAELQHRLKSYLPLWLSGYCRFMYWSDVLAIIGLADIEYEFSQQDEDEIDAFANGFRGFELSQAVLQKLLINRSSASRRLAVDLVRPAIEKIVQNRDWKDLPVATGHQGRKELLNRLRLTVQKLNMQRHKSNEKNT